MELMIVVWVVVSIVGLLTVIAIPSMAKARRTSKINVPTNDFRILHDSFNMYAMDQSGFPTSFGPAPVAAADYINIAPAGQNPIAPAADWLVIDEAIDDDDPATGELRMLAGIQIAYNIANWRV